MTAVIKEEDMYPHYGMMPSPETSDPRGVKVVAFETADTVDQGDRVDICLTTHGITYLEDVWFFTHTTTDDVVVTQGTEIAMHSTSTTDIQLLVPAGTDNKKRVIVLWGR